jgi:hypothetical protein
MIILMNACRALPAILLFNPLANEQMITEGSRKFKKGPHALNSKILNLYSHSIFMF